MVVIVLNGKKKGYVLGKEVTRCTLLYTNINELEINILFRTKQLLLMTVNVFIDLRVCRPMIRNESNGSGCNCA